MKLNYLFLLLSFLAFVFIGQVQVSKAQLVEKVVQWETSPGSGIPLKNALRDAIMTDTLADGSHAQNTVYKLLKGGYYWNVDKIDNSGFHLRIEGELGDPNDPLGNPPVIQRVYNDAQDFVDSKMIVGNGDLTMKNVYIIHCDDKGVQTAYQPIELSGNGKRYTFDNVIFERTNFAVVAVTNPNNDIFFTNCLFRNLIGSPSTQQWEGRGTSLWIDQDTVVVENCTFFNVNFTPFQLEGGAANYIRYNHNTIVNCGRQIAIDGQNYREAYFANNLLINPFWHGEGYSDYSNPNRNPRATTSGIWGINDLPSKYGPEEGRRILLANTAAWRDPLFAAYYADSIRAQPFANPITVEDYLNVYEQMVAIDTMWLADQPGLGTYFNASFITDSMIQNIKDIRAGVSPAHPYFWRLPELDPVTHEICNVCPSWPLPEDFSYTDAALKTKGTDGLPLGDLNWFPTDKATFEANKEAYITQLEALAGQEYTYPVIDKAEAETATLGGNSTIVSFQGFSYVQMDGGGYFEWQFDNPTAQQYDLNILQHMRGNSMRGQHTFINGVEIHDAAHGWGELIYDNAAGVTTGMDINNWAWVRWTQADINEAGALTLPAGQCTIRISSSWGYQNFAGVDLEPAGTGTPLIQLRIPDLTSYDVVQLKAEGAAYVPSGFKAVDLGASGTITWNFNPAEPGDYGLVVFYQAPLGTQSVVVNAGGQNINVTLEGTAGDSTGLSILTAVVPLSAGSQSISLTGGNAIIDWVQLVRRMVTSINERPEIPGEFSLSQNYPNPFNPATKINFSIAKPSNVKLTVFNVLGQRVTTLVNQFMNAGAFTVDFDASHLASGVYIYKLEAGDFKVNKKMMLLK
jgi:hypothetical protein